MWQVLLERITAILHTGLFTETDARGSVHRRRHEGKPARTVLVYREAGNTVAFLHENDELTGESVLSGFRCRVAEILPPAKVAEAKA